MISPAFEKLCPSMRWNLSEGQPRTAGALLLSSRYQTRGRRRRDGDCSMTIAAGIDVGTAAVKAVLFRAERDKTE